MHNGATRLGGKGMRGRHDRQGASTTGTARMTHGFKASTRAVGKGVQKGGKGATHQSKSALRCDNWLCA